MKIAKSYSYAGYGFDLYHPENNKPIQWDKMTVGQKGEAFRQFKGGQQYQYYNRV